MQCSVHRCASLGSALSSLHRARTLCCKMDALSPAIMAALVHSEVPLALRDY